LIGAGPDRYYTAFVGQDLCIGDSLRTDASTTAALLFAIGGRIGLNKSSTVQIVSETALQPGGTPTANAIVLRQGHVGHCQRAYRASPGRHDRGRAGNDRETHAGCAYGRLPYTPLIYIKPLPGTQLTVLVQNSGSLTIVTLNP
jgi:hypothetical protein